MKPRVAILSYNTHKYSETFIQNQVKYLPAQVYYLSGGEIPELDNEGSKFLSDKPLCRLERSIRQNVFNQPLRQQHLAALENYLLKHKIQAVLANFSITAIPVMQICRRNKIPLIVHFHGWTAYRKTVLEQYGKYYPELFSTASAIIGVSSDMLLQLQALGAPHGKLHHLVCGYNEHIFHYSDHSRNKNIFLSAGRFCDTKNPHLTILAFQKVLHHFPDARLVMAGGDENLLNACISLIQALGIENRVAIKGILSPEQIQQEMLTATALVQSSATTSLGEKEGTPVTVLEAMASGLPVVATRHGGIADVIEHNRTGLLSNEFDIAAMSENMIRINSSTELAKNIGLQASQQAEQKYSLHTYTTQLTQLIENCIFTT